MRYNLTIQSANNLPEDMFITMFENIVDHWPRAAYQLLKQRPFRNSDEICKALNQYLESMNLEEKKSVLKRYPDIFLKLAKHTAPGGEQEQTALDKIGKENKEKLTKLNDEYKQKFGIPFILSSRDNDISTILLAIEIRAANNRENEVNASMDEVKKIAKLRIKRIILE